MTQFVTLAAPVFYPIAFMTIPASRMFVRISAHNSSIDQSIESLVNVACVRDETDARSDRKQLEKTTRLLFLSSLILGERDEGDEFNDEEE